MKDAKIHSERRPSPVISVLIYLVAIGIMTWLRLYLYAGTFITLSYGLPLLICLWHRDLRLLWAMAVSFILLGAVKAFYVLPSINGSDKFVLIQWSMHVANIIVVAISVHVILRLMDRLNAKNVALEEANHELAEREEEIGRQNEELQSQSEELEEQNKELIQVNDEMNQQSETLQRQTEALQSVSSELREREAVLGVILNSLYHVDDDVLLDNICGSLPKLLGDAVDAVLLLEAVDENLKVRACYGVNVRDLPPWPLKNSFAALVMKYDKTAFIDDLRLRPDLILPEIASEFRSLLAAPIHLRGVPAGALEVFSTDVRQWTNPEFRMMEWMAAHCSLVLDRLSARKEVERLSRELLEEEREARVTAEQASRLKDEFLATLSHELRTPLNSILGWAHMMQAGSLDPGLASTAIEAIYTSAKSQTKIIDDLLDVARIVSGKMQLEPARVLLSDVLTRAISVVAHAIEMKQIRLDVDFAEGTRNLLLYADPQRLQQIFWNLISNAVKFTPSRGEIHIKIEKNSEVIISIQDSGEGISPEFLPYIFERFRQEDSSAARKFGGLGLGLSITKHLVELHGGTITAESLQGETKGAIFTLRLPLNEQALSSQTMETNREASESPYEKRLPGVRILLVDDDTNTLYMLREAFRHTGAEIRASSSAKGAVEILKHWPADLLISDVAMPDHDGYWLIREVRSLPLPASRVPAIALTANASSVDRDSIQTAGFQMFVSKPILPSQVIAEAETLLRLHSFTPGIPKTAGQIRGIDLSVLAGKKLLLIEDDVLFCDVMKFAFEEKGMQFRCAARASEALSILQEWVPDIIISDLGLPEEDGYSLIHKIRQLPDLTRATIPAVALTGYGKEEGDRALTGGFQFYKSKPIEPDELIAFCAQMIQNNPA